MVLRSVFYFRERDQGHDHVHQGDRDHGRDEVGQAHVGVNGIVKDEVRGENPLFLLFKAEKRNICYLEKCTVVFYCTNQTGICPLYTYSVSLNCCLAWFQMIFIGWDPMKNCISVMRDGAPVSGDPCYHRVCWALVITVSWVWPLGTRVFGRWSRHW